MIGAAALFTASLMSQQPVEPDDFGVVTQINLRAEGLAPSELKAARTYANCMAFPYFSIAEELEAKVSKCRSALPRSISQPLRSVLSNVDSIVTKNPGSEATLTVNEDINAQNQ